MSEEINQSSVKISELPSLSALTDDAYFVIERGTTSYKLQYSSLRSSIFSILSSLVGLNSMAYEEADDYAKFAHGHDYSDFYYFPSYGPQSNNNKYKNPLSCQVLGRFDVVKYLPNANMSSVHSISVCIPKF